MIFILYLMDIDSRIDYLSVTYVLPLVFTVE